jgi:hypothetical protein
MRPTATFTGLSPFTRPDVSVLNQQKQNEKQNKKYYDTPRNKPGKQKYGRGGGRAGRDRGGRGGYHYDDSKHETQQREYQKEYNNNKDKRGKQNKRGRGH